MRTSVLFSATLLAGSAFAQCDFDAQITPGETVLLCPNESVTLFAGEFDNYQWYQNGSLIDGATTHSLEVSYFDSGVPYTVEVTLDGCTEMSPEVLVDGLVFLPPFMIHGGDQPIGIGPMGELTFCEGQTFTLELGMPYTENIVWTNNGLPIPGETSSILEVTENGIYSVTGSPAECSTYTAGPGVDLEVVFLPPQQPEIMMSGDEICAFPLGTSYTWYLNGEELLETTACIMPESNGPYTVFVEYGQGCEVISEPYLTTNVGEQASDAPWMIYPNPSHGQINIAMDPEVGKGSIYTVFDAQGREVANGWMPLNGLVQLDLNELPLGNYSFQAAKNGRALAPATRFTIMK